ncbi:MAG TPA: hydrolase TatD [Porphyromonadaceae bacterium]|nr:hydrolase TatD [Porphyromonadaceae bacterium]
MQILDIHTHHERRQSVVSLSAVQLASQHQAPSEVALEEDISYSVGIHPWDTAADIPDAAWTMLAAVAEQPQVVAVGEAGIDKERGGAMFRQLLTLRRHVELSERLRKPLIIHDVKAHDIILGLRRDLSPAMPWCIHGFRVKPSVAEMFTRRGIYLSFGADFNEQTVRAVPQEYILAETDDADIGIKTVIATLSAVRSEDMTPVVAANAARFLGMDNGA